MVVLVLTLVSVLRETIAQGNATVRSSACNGWVSLPPSINPWRCLTTLETGEYVRGNMHMLTMCFCVVYLPPQLNVLSDKLYIPLPVTVPALASVTGIELTLEKYCQRGVVRDSSIQLATNQSAVGNAKSSNATWASIDSFYNYGSTIDDWGYKWTSTDVSKLGVIVVCANDATIPANHVAITSASVTVFYGTSIFLYHH